jgi:hypothetical protein
MVESPWLGFKEKRGWMFRSTAGRWRDENGHLTDGAGGDGELSISCRFPLSMIVAFFGTATGGKSYESQG